MSFCMKQYTGWDLKLKLGNDFKPCFMARGMVMSFSWSITFVRIEIPQQLGLPLNFLQVFMAPLTINTYLLWTPTFHLAQSAVHRIACPAKYLNIYQTDWRKTPSDFGDHLTSLLVPPWGNILDIRCCISWMMSPGGSSSWFSLWAC